MCVDNVWTTFLVRFICENIRPFEMDFSKIRKLQQVLYLCTYDTKTVTH